MPPTTVQDPIDLPSQPRAQVIAFEPKPLHSNLEVAPSHAPEYIQQQGHIVRADRKYNSKKRICGLRVTTFWLCLALAIALVLAVVGSAVGGVLASRRSSQKSTNNPSSSTPTTSSPSSPSSTNTPTPSASPSNQCPGSNNTEFAAPLTNTLFRITCGIDWTKGDAAADGNGTVQDLIGIYADSMEECIDGCDSYNHNQGGTPCAAVSYTANITEYWVIDLHANCFLKNKAGVNHQVDSVTCAELV